MTVAALYTLEQGVYSRLDGVDSWPFRRNALAYRGTDPVVCHAPCGRWSRSVKHLTKISPKQAMHLAVCAVLQVRRCGGVFEHPARSLLWEKMSLPYPHQVDTSPLLAQRDVFGGFTIEVRQCDWGHPIEKMTWLYFVGVDPAAIVLPPRGYPQGPPRHEMRRRRENEKSYARSTADFLTPKSRKSTPPAFARWLVALAAGAQNGRSNRTLRLKTGHGAS